MAFFNLFVWSLMHLYIVWQPTIRSSGPPILQPDLFWSTSFLDLRYSYEFVVTQLIIYIKFSSVFLANRCTAVAPWLVTLDHWICQPIYMVRKEVRHSRSDSGGWTRIHPHQCPTLHHGSESHRRAPRKSPTRRKQLPHAVGRDPLPLPTCYDQPTTIVPCPRNRSHFKATTDERLLPFLRNFEGAPWLN